MKKALIDPRSSRVAAVHEESFPVAAPLYWLECEDTVVPDQYELVGGKIQQKVLQIVQENKTEAQKLLELLKEKGVLEPSTELR